MNLLPVKASVKGLLLDVFESQRTGGITSCLIFSPSAIAPDVPAPFPALERSQERIQRYNVSRNSRVPRSRHVRKGHHICCSPIPAKEHTSRAADGAGTPLGAKASPLLLHSTGGRGDHGFTIGA